MTRDWEEGERVLYDDQRVPVYEFKQITQLLQIKSGERILCIGNEVFPEADVVVSFPEQHRDKENPSASDGEGNASVCHADLTNLPFQDKEFDLVICTNVLQQVNDPEAVCTELSRVAHRGWIEVPSHVHAFLYGYPADEWLCSAENGTLTFKPRPFIRNPFGNIARKLQYTDSAFRQSFEQDWRSLFFISTVWKDFLRVTVEKPDDSHGAFDSGNPVHSCASWLDCAINCMSFDQPDLDDEIERCLANAGRITPANKIVFTLKELFRNRFSSDKSLYLQLIANLKNQDLVQLIETTEKNRAEEMGGSGQEHYPILRQFFSPNVSHPPVSVIVRTHNREELLERCLSSLDEQIYPAIEVIVVNDGGRDVSQILKMHKHRYHYVHHAENKGRAGALNSGLRMATGKYIAILDDDDLFYPDHIAVLVMTLEHSSYRVAYADSLLSVYDKVDGDWKAVAKRLVFSQEHDLQLLLRTNYIPILNVLFERSLLSECGFIDERFDVLEDWDFWIRLALVTPFKHVKQVTSEYSQRAEGDNATQKSLNKFIKSQQLVAQKYQDRMTDVSVPDPNFYPNRTRQRLLSFFYEAASSEDALSVADSFTRDFQDIGWAELVIGQFNDGKVAGKVETKLPAGFNNIRFSAVASSDVTPAYLNQFDFIVDMGGREKPAHVSEEITVPVVSPSEMVQAVKQHPTFQMLYRKHRGQPLVSIVVLAKNQLAYTRLCLESVFRHTDVPYELILVDNGSTDGTKTYFNQLAARHRDVKTVLNVDNKGYGGGNNQGLSMATGDYVVVINNDVIVTKGWITNMLHAMQLDPHCGIVGPVSNSVAGYQQITDPLYALERLDRYAEIHQETYRNQIFRVERVIGFCMLIKKEVIEKIGGFDLRYGIGNFEDDDLCIRAYLAGYECLVAKEVFIHHFGSVTFKNEKDVQYRQIFYENCLKFVDKWGIALMDDGSYLGWTIDQVRQPFDVMKHYSPVIADKSVMSYMQHVAQLFGDKKYAQCEGVLLQCLEACGEDAAVRYNLLVTYMQVKDIEKAGACFDHLDADVLEVGNMRVIWFVWNNQYEEAQKLLNRLLQKYPASPVLRDTVEYVKKALAKRELDV